MDVLLTSAAISPGATVIVSQVTTITDTTRATVNVRSTTCPNIAFGEITCS